MTKIVADNKAFWFCTRTGFIGKKAHSLSEFTEAIKTVPAESLEFHLRDNKNDFAAWLFDTMQEPKIAEEMKKIKIKNLRGETLRASLSKAVKKNDKSV